MKEMAPTTSFSLASSSSCFFTTTLLPKPRILLSPQNQRLCSSGPNYKRKVSDLSPKAALRVRARGNVEATRVPSSVPVRVAHELLLAGHRYLDVRTPEEFSRGRAPGAVNIPYMYRVGSGMTKNPHFLAQVSSHFRKDDEIIVGCQSGKRSMMAATDLLAAGFFCITDIAGGHAVWSHNSLPTEF